MGFMNLFKDSGGAPSPDTRYSETDFNVENADFRLALGDGRAADAYELLLQDDAAARFGSDPIAIDFKQTLDAIGREDWEGASTRLQSWEIEYPENYQNEPGRFLDAAAHCAAKGFALVKLLDNAQAGDVDSYESLLKVGLKQVTKAVRLASGPGASGSPPVVVSASFDDECARLISNFNISRSS